MRSGLDLGGVTVLVGENGSGKSTIVEALAMAYGINGEGGSTGANHQTRPSESELWRALRLRRGLGASKWGFFLRAETMHGFYTYLENNPGRDGPLHEMSHGESFMEVLETRFDGSGLYVLDEPESALSMTGCLALVGLISDLAATGNAQAIIATHSPIIAAIPGATIYEVGEWGLRQQSWEDLDLVVAWRDFLREPQRFLRHVTNAHG